MSNEPNQKSTDTDDDDDGFYARLQRDILHLMDEDDEEYHEALLLMANLDRDSEEAKHSGVASAGDCTPVVANRETDYSTVTRDGNKKVWRPIDRELIKKTEDSGIINDENSRLSSQPTGFSYPSTQPEGINLCTYVMPTWLGSNSGGKCNGTGVFIPLDTKHLRQIKPNKTKEPRVNQKERRKPNKQPKNKSS